MELQLRAAGEICDLLSCTSDARSDAERAWCCQGVRGAGGGCFRLGRCRRRASTCTTESRSRLHGMTAGILRGGCALCGTYTACGTARERQVLLLSDARLHRSLSGARAARR
eukprot:2391639-Rhodomonas_salina.3